MYIIQFLFETLLMMEMAVVGNYKTIAIGHIFGICLYLIKGDLIKDYYILFRQSFGQIFKV